MSTNPIDALFLDSRSINDMPFGTEFPESKRDEIRTWTREILTLCAVSTADDIARLGCTGAYEAGISIENTAKLRLALGGGGVGLPCFVPIDRYCLVHETIGGLEPGQLQRHAQCVEKVSRPLTTMEQARVALVQQARRQGKKDKDAAADVLTGQDEEGVQKALANIIGDAPILTVPPIAPRLQPVSSRLWVCPEHQTTDWACRYCVAQAIVEGPLVPLFTLDRSGADVVMSSVKLEEELARADRECVGATRVMVQATTFTRKLSRD